MSEAEARTIQDNPPPRHGWAIMAALILAELVSSFEASMIYIALKHFYSIFDDPIGIGWLLTGFMLVASVSAAVGGRLGDLFGRKRVLIVALALAMGGSVLSAMSSDLLWIAIGRACQGFAGPILPLCFGMVREYFPRSSTPTNIGIVAATASAGGGVGFIGGGMLVDHGSWRMIFVASALLAGLAIVAVALLVPRSRQFAAGKVDWIGGIMFVPGITIFLFGLGFGEEHGWGSAEQLWPMVAGGAILAGWLFYELKIPYPLIDVRMVLDKQIGTTLSIMIILALGAMHVGQVALVMLQQPVATGPGLGVSATLAGLLHSPASVVGALAAPVCGWYAGRHGGRGAMLLATASATIAWTGLACAHHSIWLVTLWILISGFSMGAMMAAVPNLIVEAAPEGRTSEATGLAQIGRKIFMAIGAQVVAIALASSTVRVEGGSFPDERAYDLTYTGIAVLCAMAFLLSFRLPRRMPSGPADARELQRGDVEAVGGKPTLPTLTSVRACGLRARPK